MENNGIKWEEFLVLGARECAKVKTRVLFFIGESLC